MRPSFSSSAATPVPVVIGGTAIIATRIIGVLLLVAELGFSGVSDFISDSLQRWDTGLIFFASIVLLLLDMMCGVAVC
ncbi:YbjO family protein, partial [Yersinia pestis]